MEKPDLLQYFNENLIVPELSTSNKEECLIELVSMFYDNKLIKNQAILLEMLKQRENLGSTGIGKGVAIPHGRSTAVKEVTIAFGKSKAGIDYGAVDDKPVHLIFMVVAPPIEQSNKYLPVLGKLVEVLNNNKNRKALKEVQNFDDLKNFLNEE